MPSIVKLISIFEDARALIGCCGNDFSWTSWAGREGAIEELAGILSALRSGVLPDALSLEVLFAPTGPVQEVSLSSGWGGEFLALAERFDEATAANDA